MHISDDILVYGKSKTDHDDMLKNAFQRLREKDLTFNPKKCVYDKPCLRFQGYTFSAAGISSDCNVSRFILDYATIVTP